MQKRDRREATNSSPRKGWGKWLPCATRQERQTICSITIASNMFKRYTESARRAVYFAHAIAVLNEGTMICSTNLLQGMLWEDSSRAQTIFHLQNNFPVSRGRPWKREDANIVKNALGPGLTATSKKILAWTAQEADRLGDYWIDVEHLLLGILCEHTSAAARCVAQTGLTLKAARKTIKDNKQSRPQYGPVPLLWQVQTQPLKLIFRWLHHKR